MKRSTITAAVALIVAGVALTSGAVKNCAHRRSSRLSPSASGLVRPPEDAVLARLHEIPFYRPLLRTKELRSGRIDGEGLLHVEVDLRALVEPRLAAVGLPGASDLLPEFAQGTIAIETAGGTTAAISVRESWRFEGPSALLELLDRNPAGKLQTLALDAIPGAPSAIVCVRLVPSRLADPFLGGAALESWRDRARFAEKLIGRPLRAEIAEDLAGPAVFALYDGSDDTEAEAVLAVELRRTDRLAGLLDMLFGLGALTDRATVLRYRGVATGSFVSSSEGPGLALAVDGPILFVATSRGRLESAIDARRAVAHPRGGVAAAGDSAASWSAVSASPFVANGWGRVARAADEPGSNVIATTTAALWPEGVSGWRLEGHGPSSAIAADPILPFFRSVVGRRQREAD